VAGFIASPFMLVKTHLQAQCHQNAAVGFQVNVRGITVAATDIIIIIVVIIIIIILIYKYAHYISS
jgi:hypothetical protein